MLDTTFVFESLKRRWPVILVITVLAGLIGLASMLSSRTEIVVPSYTAESVVYVTAHESADVNEYNYVLNEDFLANDARRIVLNDSVAGEVRREFGDDVIISTPIWQSDLTKYQEKTHFIFIDATAGDETTAKAAADQAAALTVKRVESEIDGAKAHISEFAALKSNSSGVGNFGSDKLNASPVAQTASSFSFKKLVIFLGIGLIAGFACVLIFDYARRRFRTAHDVERLTGAYVIDSFNASDPEQTENMKRCAGIIDALARKHGCKSVCICGWKDNTALKNISRQLGSFMQHACIAGSTSLSLPSSDASALSAADCILLAVKQNEQSGSEIDSMVRSIYALGLPVLGAIYIQEDNKSRKDEK